jgi:hypothetical protein
MCMINDPTAFGFRPSSATGGIVSSQVLFSTRPAPDRLFPFLSSISDPPPLHHHRLRHVYTIRKKAITANS